MPRVDDVLAPAQVETQTVLGVLVKPASSAALSTIKGWRGMSVI